MTLCSHDVMNSVEFGRRYITAPKKIYNAKKRTADARAKRLWVYRFLSVG